jgi:hypothetical protein
MIPSRKFTLENTNRFKDSLRGQGWHDVLSSRDVNLSFGFFWTTFNTLFDLYCTSLSHYPNLTETFIRSTTS